MTKAFHVYPEGLFELRDPGLPLPTALTDHEIKQMMVAAVERAASLTENQMVAAALLNDSFFKMSMKTSRSGTPLDTRRNEFPRCRRDVIAFIVRLK
jgi:hypothetical protein